MSERLLHADWPAPASIVAGTTTRLGDATDLPSAPLLLQQVHGARVVRASDAAAAAEPLQADAMVADTAGAICTIRTADCLPVLFCARDGGEIGAAHAGWRGLAAGVVEATVAAMHSPPEQLLVWLGPAISRAAYEVGAEVRDAFVSQDAEAAAAFTPNARGRWQADLVALARRRLGSLGIATISGGHYCTFGDADRFYSYRRDGDTGRLLSFVYLGPG